MARRSKSSSSRRGRRGTTDSGSSSTSRGRGKSGRGRNRQESADMRGDGETKKKRKILAKAVLTPDEAKALVKDMRTTSGESYYDVTRLEDPNFMIVFDIPDDYTETIGEDGRPYKNLVPKKIVEMEGTDVIEVYHDTSLKAPTMILNAIYGSKDREAQVEEDHVYMSYANWLDYKDNPKGYHKVMWDSEAAGGFYERIYNSAD